MKHRTKNLIKNTGILTLSSFASKLLSFFLVPLYTSVLSTEEFGNYDIILSTLTILLPLVTLNISDAVMRFTMDKEKEPDKAASVGLWFTLSGIAIAIILSSVVGFTPLIKYVSGLRVISVVFFAALAFNSYLTQLAKGKEKVLDMGIAGIIGTATAIITNLLFLLVFRMGLKGFFYAGILGSAIPDIYYFFRLKVWHYFKTGKV
ncbi:MAG: oligosaccharide flippase family protein, partial [Clostridia bacterium]|nr:oligosaccharide flippase family protein [Clostridia bacterium]